MVQKLSGKKSYLAGGGLVLLGIGVVAGFVSLDEKQLEGLMAILAGAATVFLRLAVSKAAGAAADAGVPVPPVVNSEDPTPPKGTPTT